MRRYCYANIVCTSTDLDVKLDLAIRPGDISEVFTATKLCSVMFCMTTCSLLAKLSVAQ